MERFIRGGIAAAPLGGLLVAAGAALTVVSAGHQQFSDQVLTGVFTVSAALRFTGAIWRTWGIISLYLAQADRAGRLGLIAVVACMANMALQTGWIFCGPVRRTLVRARRARCSQQSVRALDRRLHGRMAGSHLLRPARHCHPAGAGTAQDVRARADHRRCYHPGAVAGRRARL